MDDRNVLVAMLSVGARSHLTDYSFARAARWASRHGYSAVLVKQSLHGNDRVPHFGKVQIPGRFPGFDLYCILDDDLLISSKAPGLPELPSGTIGFARDAEQRHTTHPKVKWTANTGFMLITKDALDLLQKAYKRGDVPSVWPRFSDQSALNAVGWEEQRIVELDQRWNYQVALEYFLRGRGWDTWCASRLYRVSLYLRLLLWSRNKQVQMARNCWGLHMIRAGYPRFFDLILP